MKEEGIESCNILSFLKALSIAVGGEAKQRSITTRQIEIAEGQLIDSQDLGSSLAYIYDRYTALGMPANEMNETFWRILTVISDNYFTCLMEGFPEDTQRRDPMSQILSFVSFAKGIEIIDNMTMRQTLKARIMREAKAIVARFLQMALDKGFLTNRRLTVFDWVLIYGSILTTANHNHFLEHFSLEKVLVEQKFHESSAQCTHGLCPVVVCR